MVRFLMILNLALRYQTHYMRGLLSNLLLIFFILTSSPTYAAIDCNSVFPGPIQSFSSTGELYMQSGALIENVNKVDVCFKQVRGYEYEMNALACGIGKCEITGIPSLARAAPTFVTSSVTSSYVVANNTTSTVELGTTAGYGQKFNNSRWDIGALTINTGGNVTVSDTYSTYVIKDLTFYNAATMTLKPGKTYIIDGDLNLNSGTLNIVGSGDTKLYIKGSFIIDGVSQLTGLSTLDVYIQNDLLVRGSAKVQGSYYVAGNATLQETTVLTGRLSAKNVTLQSSSKVVYDAGAPVLQCFNDDFSQSALSSDWVVSRSSGSFIPSIVGGRMRLTQASQKQSTASTYQRLFPAAENLVEIQFDHYAYGGATNNGADGIAVVLSDAAITPQPGAFGGPLGYGFKPGINGFAGGWLGVGIDEFGNFSGEGGNGNVGQRRQSVAVRGSGAGTSGYNYLHGTCNDGKTNTSGSCLSPTVDKNNVTPAHRYKITIDSQSAGQSMVKIERNTGSGFVTLISSFNAAAQTGQATIPKDFLLSLTGSTGDYYNNHEIDNVQICALKSNPITTQIDHFEFDHTGQGLTCNPETVTIRACANTSCSQLFTEPLTATLLPESTAEGVWVGGNQVSFSGGTAQLQLRRNTAGVVTLGVKGSSPTTRPLSKTLCRIGAGALSENNCSLTFADSGFIFDVPDKLANKPVEVLVKAVKKSDVTQQCIPSFQNQAKSLSFWSQYVEPSAPITPKAVTINSTAISAASAVPTALSLGFDINGQAKITVNYPDAGKLQLNAQYTGSGTEQGLVMTGSDQFVSVPAGLCVKPVDGTALCPSANMSCNVYRKAGQTFGMTVQAVAWQADNDSDFCSGNLPTPNFSDDSMMLASKVVAPTIASGANNGVLGVTSYSHSAQTNNLNTINNQTISEVGVFQISATASANYLGTSTSLNIPTAYSANIGRFVPDRFLIGDISVLPACGGFSYMDQPFPMSMSIKALNIGGTITQNYFPPFSFATAKLVGENNNNGVDLQNRLSALPIKADSWSQGMATVDGSFRANVNRVTPNMAANLYQDGPFELLDIGVQVSDNDPHPNGIFSYVASPDMDAASTGACTNCNAKKITTQILRHGRVVMDNTYGPETEVLKMPTRAEYWNGTNWVLNGDDSCTIATYGLGSQVDNAGLGYHFDPNLATGQSVVRSGGTSTFQSGQFELLWRAVATSGPLYRGQVTAPLDVPAWLEWYWNWNGVSPTSLSEPRASAFFGRYRGHDRIIYWREVN
ncbi:MSHA biogenesis protein MshQ [Shewanella putrefaciens]|uniref:DUF6701 domain-containing protein n=1 Tax=Shewanella putrefaciens TaxID=24 RepID=UPI0021C1A667|nr:DUF6701 domain-containing protein [Shewanella putrefaciens]UXK08172.1 MSHA biogenesis protein MshQ [Shewanella putrefaciens]